MSSVVDACTMPGAGFPADALIRAMDAAGITRAVTMPQNQELAVRNREGNQRLLDLAAAHSPRFIPACAASPWQGSEALEILSEAFRRGARLLVFAPAVQGFSMTDALVDPLLERAAEHGLPVYVHTGPHAFGAPSQTVLAARNHPRTRFILGHCGSTDHAWDMPSIAKHHLGKNLWLETSLVRPWAVPAYLEAAGEGRVIFGSAAPLNDPAFELEQLAALLPPSDHPGFYGGNLLNLIGDAP